METNVWRRQSIWWTQDNCSLWSQHWAVCSLQTGHLVTLLLHPASWYFRIYQISPVAYTKSRTVFWVNQTLHNEYRHFTQTSYRKVPVSLVFQSFEYHQLLLKCLNIQFEFRFMTPASLCLAGSNIYLTLFTRTFQGALQGASSFLPLNLMKMSCSSKWQAIVF